MVALPPRRPKVLGCRNKERRRFMRIFAKLKFGSLVAIAIATTASPCFAQTTSKFPLRPVRIIVPFTAGSASDLIARRVGSKMSETWGQQVVVDNRGGAG